ncbi:MICOS complex subunit MIC19 [Parasteatoda tepidariorum]|uniref:MICOS complex subunit MIC19 n=1 Tax=Parasteatoda tepidariorum TaxID=114398 RepID=UPI00077F9A32|nr:MICOS complex subunit MIC19 [Parasteatoda tepidariorum]
MGNNASSNRTVTFSNDDVVGVVQVSENVVRRLRGEPEKTPEQRHKPIEAESKHTPEIPTQKFVPFAPTEPFSSTLEQRQKYHEEFKKAERSWNNRINELETQNKVLYDSAKEKFAAMLNEIEENHVKNSFAPVCPDKQVLVERCFRENSKYPLNCSQEVKDFMNCVDKVRMTALSK